MTNTAGRHTMQFRAETRQAVGSLNELDAALVKTNDDLQRASSSSSMLGAKVSGSANEMDRALRKSGASVQQTGAALVKTGRDADAASLAMAKYSEAQARASKEADTLSRALAQQNAAMKRSKEGGGDSKEAERARRAEMQRLRALSQRLRLAEQIASRERRALDDEQRKEAQLDAQRRRAAREELQNVRRIAQARQRLAAQKAAALQKQQALAARQTQQRQASTTARLDVVGAAGTQAALAGAAAGAALLSGAISGVSIELLRSARAAGKFEQQIARTAAVTKDGQQNLVALKNAALDAGLSTAFSAQEAAEAQQMLAQAGFTAQQQIAALPDVLRLSSAGNLELAETANLASNVMSVYKFNADELGSVNDRLAGTFTRSNTTLSGLAKSFEFVGAQAKASGQDFDGVLAALGQLGNAGIQADKAGTGLRAALTSLEKTTPKAASALKKLGVETRTSDGQLRQLVDILDDLQRAGATNTQILEIFGKVGGTSVQVLLGQGIPALRKFQTELGNTAGLTAKIESSVLQTFEGRLQILSGTIDTARILIGDQMTPALGEMTEAITHQATAFIKDANNLKEFKTIGNDIVLVSANLAQMVALLIPKVAMLFGLFLEGGKQLGSFNDKIQTLQSYIPAFVLAEGAVGTLTGALSDNAKAGGEVGKSYQDATALGDRFAQQMQQLSARLDDVGHGINRNEVGASRMAKAWSSASKAVSEYRLELGGTSITLGRIATLTKGYAKDAKDALEGFLGLKKEIQKPVKTPKPKRRDSGAAQRRREQRANERAAEIELRALGERDKLKRIEIKLEADLERLRARKMGAAQRELEETRLRNRANEQTIQLLEKQDELERKKSARAEDARQQVNILRAGNTARAIQLQYQRDLWQIEQQRLEGGAKELAMLQASERMTERLDALAKQRADTDKKNAQLRARQTEQRVKEIEDAGTRLANAFSSFDDDKLGRIAQGFSGVTQEVLKTSSALVQLSDKGASAEQQFVAGVQGSASAFSAAADAFNLSQRAKSGVLAAFYTAEGFGQASVGNAPGSVAAFTAAGLHAAVAAGAGGGGAGGGAGGGGAGGSSPGEVSPGFASRGDTDAQQRTLARYIGDELDNRGGQTIIYQIHAEGAAFLSDEAGVRRSLESMQPPELQRVSDTQFRSLSRGSL